MKILISERRFTAQETFDTTHNFTWISIDESLAFRRQHSISAWYPYDKYTVSTTLEVFSGSNTSGAAPSLPIRFLHLYGGLSGHNLRIDTLQYVKTSRSNLALYVVFSVRVSPVLAPSTITQRLTQVI